jgi:hypothetical protein
VEAITTGRHYPWRPCAAGCYDPEHGSGGDVNKPALPSADATMAVAAAEARGQSQASRAAKPDSRAAAISNQPVVPRGWRSTRDCR